MKTNKSYTKRLKTTRTGKVLARGAGSNHFNAKKSGEQQMRAKRWREFPLSSKKKARFLGDA